MIKNKRCGIQELTKNWQFRVCTACRYCVILHHWFKIQPPGCRSESKRICKPWLYAKILQRSTLPKKHRADIHIETTVNNQKDHLGCREKFLVILKNRSSCCRWKWFVLERI